jgi:translation initiation factor 2-alpha kinase 4
MPHGSEPRTHKEVDFDIVSHNTLDLALKEAEVIKVLDEIIEEFPPLRSSPMSFLINHSDLLQLIMEFCRITPSQVPLVKEVISKLNFGKWTMQKIRSELRSPAIGVASTSLDDLARFDFRGSFHFPLYETVANAHQTLLSRLKTGSGPSWKVPSSLSDCRLFSLA